MIQFLNDYSMQIILALVILVIFMWLRAESNNSKSHIDFADLVSENGKLNERKLVRMGTWVVSTWGFIFLTLNHNLSEWYFIGYMGTWVANALIGGAIKTKQTQSTQPE